jgi:hypothetical protein
VRAGNIFVFKRNPENEEQTCTKEFFPELNLPGAADELYLKL